MRTKLNPRRKSENMKVIFVGEGGSEWKLLVTLGFNKQGEVKDVFCSSFKVGTSLNAIVMDACILISRLLQWGDTPSEIAASMCEPPSLVGTIAAAIAKRESERGDDIATDSPKEPDPPVGGEMTLAAAE